MAPTARLPPKKDVALALLEQASMYIHLDPRAETVQVPAWFKKQPQLVLQVGLNMAVPIPDLHVDEQGLSCTLSFNRSPFFCMIPWRSVFALVGENGQAMVWAEDVPAEVAAQAQAQKAPEKPRTHLRSVAEGESAPAPRAVEPKIEKKKPGGKPSAVSGKPSPAKPSAVEPTAPLAAKRKAKERALKVAARAKPGAKPVAAKSAPQKAAPQKAVAQPALAKQAPHQKPALAAKPASKPMAARTTTESGKPKRELPAYLRVVK